jgi:hypothetical protein
MSESVASANPTETFVAVVLPADVKIPDFVPVPPSVTRPVGPAKVIAILSSNVRLLAKRVPVTVTVPVVYTVPEEKFRSSAAVVTAVTVPAPPPAVGFQRTVVPSHVPVTATAVLAVPPLRSQ